MAALGNIQTIPNGGYAGKIKYFSANGGGNKILSPGQTYQYSDLRSHHSGSNTKRTDGYPRDYTVLHGTNLQTSPNADIPVPLNSEVIYKATAGGYGNTVVVKNQTGNMLFGHLSKFGNFKVGDKIKAGTIIGTQGKTGGNYVDHLHIDANPAGHEAFVNFITSGKPTFGSTGSSSGDSPGQSSSDMEVTPPAEIQFDPNYRDPSFIPLDQLKQLEGANQTIGASNIMQNLIPNNSATVSSPSGSRTRRECTLRSDSVVEHTSRT